MTFPTKYECINVLYLAKAISPSWMLEPVGPANIAFSGGPSNCTYGLYKFIKKINLVVIMLLKICHSRYLKLLGLATYFINFI